jgi:hypothetical protein
MIVNVYDSVHVDGVAQIPVLPVDGHIGLWLLDILLVHFTPETRVTLLNTNAMSIAMLYVYWLYDMSLNQ